jgi:uncharacterized protein YdaU (DUF1376 family)
MHDGQTTGELCWFQPPLRGGVVSRSHFWMPFYLGDYFQKTQQLSCEEHGAYFLLICACWAAAGRLPNTPDRLAVIARLSRSRWLKIAPTILLYFEVEGDFLVHRRVIEEREKADRFSDVQRANGKKGGRPRKPMGLGRVNPNESPRVVDVLDRGIVPDREVGVQEERISKDIATSEPATAQVIDIASVRS